MVVSQKTPFDALRLLRAGYKAQRAARPDPSLRKGGLLRMTIGLTHYPATTAVVREFLTTKDTKEHEASHLVGA